MAGLPDPMTWTTLGPLWQAAVIAGASGDTVRAATAWDEVIVTLGSQVGGSAEVDGELAHGLVSALLARLAVPLTIPVDVAVHVQPLLGSPGDHLTAVEQALVILVLALTWFNHGRSPFAEVLRVAQNLLDLLADSVELPPAAPAVPVAVALGHVASVYLTTGAFELARQVLDRAERLLGLTPLPAATDEVVEHSIEALLAGSAVPMLDLGGPGVSNEAVMWVRQLQADARSHLGQEGTAIATYQALALAYGPQRGWTMVVNASDVLVRYGRGEAALHLLEGINPQHRSTAGATIELIEATARFDRGDVEEAARLAARVIAHVEAVPDAELLPDVQILQAKIARSRQDRPAAITWYWLYLEAALRTREASMGYMIDSLATRETLPHVRSLAELLVEAGDAAGLLTMAEMVKGAHLRAVLAEATSPPDRSGVAAQSAVDAGTLLAALHAEVVRCSREIQRLRRRLATTAPGDHNVDSRASLSSALARAQEERRDLLATTDQYDPVWAVMSQVSLRSPEDLHHFFGEGKTAGLTLLRFDGLIRSILVDADGIQIGAVEFDDQAAARLDRFVRNLVDASPIQAWWDPRTLGLDAEDFVPADLWERAKTSNALVIAGHRELHLLPWAMLPRGTGRLVEEIAISVAPSLSCVPPLAQPLPLPRRLAAFGPPATPGPQGEPLVNADAEVQAAFTACGAKQPNLWVKGEAATTERLMELLRNADANALHVASHAVSVPNEPWSSGIITSDGVLDAVVLSKMRTITPEIVASACTTGWRPSSVADVDLLADDCLGIPAAFLLGGARALLVSISELGDVAASELLTSYHRHRSAGAAPIHALRSAQLEALGRRDVELWCGLTLYGSPHASHYEEGQR